MALELSNTPPLPHDLIKQSQSLKRPKSPLCKYVAKILQFASLLDPKFAVQSSLCASKSDQNHQKIRVSPLRVERRKGLARTTHLQAQSCILIFTYCYHLAMSQAEINPSFQQPVVYRLWLYFCCK